MCFRIVMHESNTHTMPGPRIDLGVYQRIWGRYLGLHHAMKHSWGLGTSVLEGKGTCRHRDLSQRDCEGGKCAGKTHTLQGLE